MEPNRRNQRSYLNEDENWDQNQGRQGRENDYNQSRNYQGNYGDENAGRGNEYRQSRSNYRNAQDNDNDWNNSGNQYNQGAQNSGRRYDDDYGNNLRTRQNEGYNRNQDSERNFSNSGSDRNFSNSGSDRNFGNRNNDDQRNYGSSNFGRNQGSNSNTQNRDWIDRTRDEVSSWFGDDDAERRRRTDREKSGEHRGKGPKEYQRSSDRIREDVCDRLSDDSYVDATEIDIKVNGTEVVLSGTVDSKEAKRRAEDIAESVSGVSNVQNQLRVQSSQSSTTSYQARPQQQATGNQLKQEKELRN